MEYPTKEEDPIVGYLEFPVADSLATDMMTVVGWAFSVAGPITHVEMSVDGLLIGQLQYGVIRKDVHRVHPNILEACGYREDITLGLSIVGPTTLIVHVVDACGNERDFAQSIIVRPQVGRMHVDAPRTGEITAGGLAVSGWAFSLRAPIVTIEALLDGISLGEICYGLPRHDVYSRFHYPAAARCGFEGTLTFPPPRFGEAILTIRAADMLGFSMDTDVPIRLTRGELAGEIERAAWRDGTLEISGWGILPPTTGPRFARLFVNDRLVDQTRLHLSRPDIHRRFPAQPQSGRSGFQFRQPLALPDDPDVDSLAISVEIVDDHDNQLQRQTHVLRDTDARWGEHADAVNRLRSAIAALGDREGREPSILDWHTGLHLAQALPERAVFSPHTPADAPHLPYLDHSIDLVVVPSSHPAYLTEARRVAGSAVARLRGSADPDAREGVVSASAWDDAVEIEWREDATPPAAIGCSIIIPVHNNAHHTQRCLSRLRAVLPDNFSGEIIVVDDASTDDTPNILSRWTEIDTRIRVLRRAVSMGFVHSCNWGAAAATAEVLVFLNNDTLPERGWLPPLLRVLHDHPRAGAVGGKLLYPDRTLQEAGGLIFSDGSGWNFGRHDEEIDFPLYNYLREVDYCSGALLATRRALFTEAGGFDVRYAPAYYEDVDYCFQLRTMGYAVYYQPESVVVHFEGASSGTDLTRGVKRYQVLNRPVFVEKWGDVLRRYPAPPDRYDRPSRYAFAVRDGEAEHGAVTWP